MNWLDPFGIGKRKKNKEARRLHVEKMQKRVLDAKKRHEEIMKEISNISVTIKSCTEVNDLTALALWRDRRQKLTEELEELRPLL